MAYVAKGYYLEEFEIGKCYESVGRTITEADVVNFAGISGDFNPLHMDDEFAKNKYVRQTCCSRRTGADRIYRSVQPDGYFEGTTIAFLELTAKYTAPLCIGDTVHLEMTPTEARHSKKLGRGILKTTAKLVNQEGTVIMDAEWTFMMKAKE